MKNYQATFEGRGGRKVTMPVKATGKANAQDIASFFQLANGRLLRVDEVRA